MKESNLLTEDNQNKHSERVFEFMQKMQSFGHPPKEIVGDFGNPNDVSNIQGAERLKGLLEQNGLCPDAKLQFDAHGRPIIPEGFPENIDQCRIS